MRRQHEARFPHPVAPALGELGRVSGPRRRGLGGDHGATVALAGSGCCEKEAGAWPPAVREMMSAHLNAQDSAA
jgi:hypothetical protein